MLKRLVAISLFAALAATSVASADSQHYATATTKPEARRLATAQARTTAEASSLCFRPARQVRECQSVDGGFRCRADTSDSYRTCKRAGWVNTYVKDNYAAVAFDPWRTGGRSAYYPVDSTTRAVSSTLYGRYVQPDGGPPPPPPFPVSN